LQELLPSQTCVIFLLDEVNGHKELFAEVAASPYTDMFRNVTLQLNEGAPGFSLSRRKAMKFDTGKLVVEGVELTTLLVYEKSALVAPLATAEELLGVIYLGRPEASQFSAEELQLLEEYAAEASTALANSLLYQRTITGGLHDPLTRLYNGLYLRERTREEVMRGRRYTYPVSLILVDLDRFQEIQSALGQETCDQILKDVAEIIRQATRETDIPARLEGDDFAVLLVHSDRNNAFSIGERIRHAIHTRPFGTGPARVSLTASVGVAGVPHDATNEEQLQLRAEAAVQQARSQGGNSVSFWNGQRVEI
ncbi:MAG: sensor domain-containing diguanylate cyclase, partial [Candidatus Eremiobacterota bacterium]